MHTARGDCKLMESEGNRLGKPIGTKTYMKHLNSKRFKKTHKSIIVNIRHIVKLSDSFYICFYVYQVVLWLLSLLNAGKMSQLQACDPAAAAGSKYVQRWSYLV